MARSRRTQRTGRASRAGRAGAAALVGCLASVLARQTARAQDDFFAPPQAQPAPAAAPAPAPAAPPRRVTGLPRVHEVLVEGATRVDPQAVRVHVDSQPGQPFDPKRVDADLRAVWGMGFFEDVAVELRPLADGQTDLVFRLSERPLVKSVKIKGNDDVKEKELDAALAVRPGTIYDPEKARRGIRAATTLFEKEGYPDVKITPVLEPTDVPGEVGLVYQVEQGPKVGVCEIEFAGNDNLSGRELRGAMETKEKWFLSWLLGGGTLDKEVIATDAERVTAYYYDQGFVNVRVDEPEIKRDEDCINIVLHVTEGEKYAFGKIAFSGAEVLGEAGSAKSLEEAIRAQTGETFRSSILREDVESLTDALGDHGYAFANVSPDTFIDVAKKQVDVTFRMDPGHPVRIGRIEVTGNSKTRDKVVRREMKVSEQEQFSATRLRRSRDALQRLGFFQDVNVTTRKSDVADEINVLVDVKEASTGTFSAGAGFSSDNRFLFNVRVVENNFLGRGLRVAANADVGSIMRNVYLSATDPYFLDTYFMTTATLFNYALEFPDFTREATGISLRALYPFEQVGLGEIFGLPLEETMFGLEYRFEQASVYDLALNAPASIYAERGSTFISSVAPGILRNTLNHAFDPTSGSFQDLSVEVAGLGGDTRFVLAELRGRWYWPFYNIPTLGPIVGSVGGGVAWGRGENGISGKEIPLIDRFFPGGISGPRGYEVRTLGPREKVFDPRGLLIRDEPIGGTNQLVMQNEIIFPLVPQVGLRGVVFFDMGNAWLQSQGIDVGDLRYGTGAGLRWLSPMGPLRIEYGIPLNLGSEEESSGILFSFGAPL